MKMIIPFVDLKKQYVSIKKDVDAAIGRVLDNSWFILGRETDSFEKEFASYAGAKYGVGTGNGTDAIRLALMSCGIGRGDEVITVSFTAAFTALAVSSVGAIPVFVDIDADTYTIDTSRIEKAITGKTRAILPVHLYGHPADMLPVMSIAKKHGLFVIEDACHAHGAEYMGRKAGTIGDIGCFSFYPSKNLGAYGDAGMVLTDNKEFAGKVRILRDGGKKNRYEHVLKGINSRFDEIQSAVLRVKLKHLDRWNAQRRKIACEYNRLIQNPGVILPAEKRYARHSYHIYAIRMKKRSRLRDFLSANGIATEIHYPVPVHRQTAYRNAGKYGKKLAVTEKIAKEIMSLPIFPELPAEDAHRIAKMINKFKI